MFLPEGESDEWAEITSTDPADKLPVTQFQEVPWRLGDALVGSAALLIIATADFLLRGKTGTWPPPIAWGMTAVPYGLLIGYPLWLARRRSPSFRLRLPTLKQVVIEGIVAACRCSLECGPW